MEPVEIGVVGADSFGIVTLAGCELRGSNFRAAVGVEGSWGAFHRSLLACWELAS